MFDTLACDVPGRKERWRQFNAPGFLFFIRYNDPDCGLPRAPKRCPAMKQEWIEYALRAYEYTLKRAEYVHDDSVPRLNMITGTEIFAEALGCKVYRPDDSNPFALACVTSAEEADRITVPELSDSSLAYLFDVADTLREKAGPDAVFSPVDIQSPMDIAALVWDKASLFVAMIETPEAVKTLAAKCRQLLTAFMDEWFSRYGTEFVAHHPDYFMSGGLTLSEDEIGAVNEDMFNTFFRDELVALSEHFGGLGIHCCADARHQWANLRRLPNLRVLNFNRPPKRGPEYIDDAFAFFADGPVQMHAGRPRSGPPETWPAQVPPNARAVFEIPATDRDTAIALCDKLNAVRHASALVPGISACDRPSRAV